MFSFFRANPGRIGYPALGYQHQAIHAGILPYTSLYSEYFQANPYFKRSNNIGAVYTTTKPVHAYKYQLPKPVYQYSKPVYKQSKPVYQQSKPVYQQSKPTYQQSNQIYHVHKPVYKQNKPVYQPRKPVYQKNKPVYQQSKPIHHQRKQVYQHSKPVYQQSKLTYHQSTPVYQQSKPIYGKEKPTYKHPKPVYQKRNQINQIPNPVYQSQHPTFQQEKQIHQLPYQQNKEIYTTPNSVNQEQKKDSHPPNPINHVSFPGKLDQENLQPSVHKTRIKSIETTKPSSFPPKDYEEYASYNAKFPLHTGDITQSGDSQQNQIIQRIPVKQQDNYKTSFDKYTTLISMPGLESGLSTNLNGLDLERPKAYDHQSSPRYI